MKQFYDDVVWGELDYLVVDLPPGTSDVTLTVMEHLKVDGIVVVSTPQDLVRIIVNKSIHMAKKMNTPILGVVENMSYFKCDKCDEKHYLFGKSRTAEVLKQHKLNLIAELPIDKELTALSDEGKIELYSKVNLSFADMFEKNLLKEINNKIS